MSDGAGATAYLVVRRDDGFGDVFPLSPGHRHTMGRATTNRIVLKDELCSREHAEVYQDEGKWCLRDLNSLNGTRVNGEILNAREWELSVNDEVSVGRTNLVFVDDLSNLPNLSATTPSAADSVKIKKRLGQTRFLTPGRRPTSATDVADRPPSPGPRPGAALSAGAGHGGRQLLPGPGPHRARRPARGHPRRGRRHPLGQDQQASWRSRRIGIAIPACSSITRCPSSSPTRCCRARRRSWPRTSPATATCAAAKA